MFVGAVISSNKTSLLIDLKKPIKRLDGLRIIKGDDEFGITVDKITKNNIEVQEASAGVVTIESYKIKPGNYKDAKVLVTFSKSLANSIVNYTNKIDRKTNPLDLKYIAQTGSYPILIEKNSNIEIVGDMLVSEAKNNPISKETIIKQLSRFENTKYYIENIEIELSNNAFLPLGLINNMRRNLIEKLDEKKDNTRTINKTYSFEKINIIQSEGLKIQVETLDQFLASYNLGFKSFIIKDVDLYNIIKNKYNNLDLELSLPRIIKDYDFALSKEDTLLVNEVGSINKYSNAFGVDEYLNTTNIYAAHFLFNRGAKRIAFSPEVSKDRVLSFLKRYKEAFSINPNMELILYDRLDLMITKYCAIRTSKNFKIQCNLCKKHNYYLKDRINEQMPIVGTDLCGNRILNAKTTCLFKYKKELENNNLKNFRINFTTETKEEVIEVLNSYLYDVGSLSGDKYTYGRFIK